MNMYMLWWHQIILVLKRPRWHFLALLGFSIINWSLKIAIPVLWIFCVTFLGISIEPLAGGGHPVALQSSYYFTLHNIFVKLIPYTVGREWTITKTCISMLVATCSWRLYICTHSWLFNKYKYNADIKCTRLLVTKIIFRCHQSIYTLNLCIILHLSLHLSTERLYAHIYIRKPQREIQNIPVVLGIRIICESKRVLLKIKFV